MARLPVLPNCFAGEHAMWVTQRMGHLDWTMLARRYGRWMSSADRQAGEKASTLFAKKMLSECCLFDQK
ncbi:MAG: hypothetical protein ON057_000122 [Glomeribacter sp. 1016415]|nr:hypothetical protein [Glomeribacter sp. 1016415]